MLRTLHAVAGALAALVIGTFLLSTLLAEVAGGAELVLLVKRLVVTPGLWVLIPLLALTGLSGGTLAGPRPGTLARAKLARMRWIAATGLLVLVPCALLLEAWAARGPLDLKFGIVQGIELLAGLSQLRLVGLNIADGLKLRRAATRRAAVVSRPPASAA
jgi:hypothetical protein